MPRSKEFHPNEPTMHVSMQSKPDGGVKIIVSPNEEGWDVLRTAAARRSVQTGSPKSVEYITAEGLRLERLLADKRLLIRVKGKIKELLGC